MIITVFRSRLRPEHAAEFQALADQLRRSAEAMPGFISYKVYAADDGERCGIIEFDTAEHLRAWREQSDHQAAQLLGRERYYQEYRIVVADPLRESHFEYEAPDLVERRGQ